MVPQIMAQQFPVRVVSKSADHCQLVQANVFLTYTTGPATDSHISALVEGLDQFFTELPTAMNGAYILVTRGTARPPEGESRRKVEEAFARHSRRLCAAAIVVEASGFSGAVLRTVASTLFLLSQRGFPARFFALRAECVPWVSKATGMPEAQLLSLFEHARVLVGR